MKDFDSWNIYKKNIEENSKSRFYRARDIWWCSMGINIGDEQDGTGKNFDRPVVVIKGFNKNIFFGVTLTGKEKHGKFYFYLGKIGNKDSSAVLSQVRLFDTKRLVRKIGVLDLEIFNDLKDKLVSVLFK